MIFAAVPRLCRNCRLRRPPSWWPPTGRRPSSGAPLAPHGGGVEPTLGGSQTLALPAGALRARAIQRRGGRKPIGHPDRDLGPADTPWIAGAVPPDPAPAVVKANKRVIGA